MAAGIMQTAPRNQPPPQVSPGGTRAKLSELAAMIDNLEKAIDSLEQATGAVRRPTDHMPNQTIPMAVDASASEIAQRVEALTAALRNQRDRIDQVVGALDL